MAVCGVGYVTLNLWFQRMAFVFTSLLFLFVRDRFDANCVLGEAKLEVNSPHAGI